MTTSREDAHVSRSHRSSHSIYGSIAGPVEGEGVEGGEVASFAGFVKSTEELRLLLDVKSTDPELVLRASHPSYSSLKLPFHARIAR
jgi:hypothetical protein